MKLFKDILFFCLTGVFLLSSCSEQEEFKSSLHIVSLINPNEAFKVQVQKTAPTLGDHTDLNVNDATVVIFNNSSQEEIEMFPVGDGFYVSNGTRPLGGYDYEIQVRAAGFEDAAATTYVPDLGSVSVNLGIHGSDTSEDEETNRVEFTFSPTMISSKPSNFFAYELVENIADVEVEQTEEEENSQIFIGTRPEENIKTLSPVLGPVLEGETIPVETTNTFDAEIEDISVRIVAVSSEFYDYLISKTDESTAISSSVLNKNSVVYTNFIGDAYGIFGGFNEKTIKLVQ